MVVALVGAAWVVATGEGGGRGGGEEKMQGSTEDGRANPIIVTAKIAWHVAARLKKLVPILSF